MVPYRSRVARRRRDRRRLAAVRHGLRESAAQATRGYKSASARPGATCASARTRNAAACGDLSGFAVRDDTDTCRAHVLRIVGGSANTTSGAGAAHDACEAVTGNTRARAVGGDPAITAEAITGRAVTGKAGARGTISREVVGRGDDSREAEGRAKNQGAGGCASGAREDYGEKCGGRSW